MSDHRTSQHLDSNTLTPVLHCSLLTWQLDTNHYPHVIRYHMTSPWPYSSWQSAVCCQSWWELDPRPSSVYQHSQNRCHQSQMKESLFWLSIRWVWWHSNICCKLDVYFHMCYTTNYQMIATILIKLLSQSQRVMATQQLAQLLITQLLALRLARRLTGLRFIQQFVAEQLVPELLVVQQWLMRSFYFCKGRCAFLVLQSSSATFDK